MPSAVRPKPQQTNWIPMLTKLLILASLLQLSYCSQNALRVERLSEPALERPFEVICRNLDTAIVEQMWWSKGDKNITNKLEKQQVVLTFPSLNISHISNYTCNAKFKNGGSASIPYFLGFYVPPNIQASPNVNEEKTRNVSLSCSVSGYPLTDDIWWTFRHKNLSSTLVSTEWSGVSSRNSTLSIVDVGDDKNGTYHCHYGTVSSHVQLKVLSEPTVQFHIIKAVGKSSIFFNWTIHDGNSPLKDLTLSYKQSDQQDVKSEIDLMTSTSQYILKELKANTQYTDFSLIAVNDIGIGRDMRPDIVTTFMNDTVFVPTVSVTAPTSDSVTLNVPGFQKVNDFYHYFNVTVTDEGESRAKSLTERENPFSITSLKPGSTYTFQVQACSDYTNVCGEPSKAITHETMDVKPPQNLTVQCEFNDKTNEGVITARWFPPKNFRGTIEGYEVTLQREAIFVDRNGNETKSTTLASRTVNSDTLALEFTNEPDNTNFTVSLCAKYTLKTCGELEYITCRIQPKSRTQPNSPFLTHSFRTPSPFEESRKWLEDLETKLKHPTDYNVNIISNIAKSILHVVESTTNATGQNRVELVATAIRVYSLLLTEDVNWKNIQNETERSQTANDLLVAIEKTILTVNSTFTAINETILFNSSALPLSEFKAAYGTVKSSLNGVDIIYPNSPPPGESFIKVTAVDLEVTDRLTSFVGVTIDSKHIELVMPPSLIRINNENASGSKEKVINSNVIALTVNDDRLHAEAQKGNITTYVKFYHKVNAYGKNCLTVPRKLHPGEKPQAVRGSAACTYWSAKENLWITDGCEVYKTSRRSTQCKCDHLTSFAVIMDVHNYVGKDPILEVLTQILCPISGVCLILAIILLSTVKSVQNQRTTITSHLCLCLLLGIILILFVADRNYFHLSSETCAAVGIVTHYWFLAAFTWMGLEGVCLYKMIIRVFDSHRISTKLYIMAGYGLPAVLVGLTCAVGYGLRDEPYGNDLFCWLNGSYHWGFVGPAAVMTIGNIIVLYLVVKAAQNQGSFAPTANAQKRSNKTWIQGLFSITVLLGVTWVPGFVVLTNSEIFATISAYLFVLLNASQGIFLFIFNCVMNEKVRKFVQVKSFWFAASSTSGPHVITLTRNVNTSTT